MDNYVPTAAPGVLRMEGDQTGALGEQTREKALHGWLQPFIEEFSEGASSSTDDAPRAVVDTMSPPAISLLTHTSARPKPRYFKSFSKQTFRYSMSVLKKRNPKIDRKSNHEKSGGNVTADHKILDGENELRLQKIHAVVIHDLVTQSIQSFPCTNRKDSTGNNERVCGDSCHPLQIRI